MFPDFFLDIMQEVGMEMGSAMYGQGAPGQPTPGGPPPPGSGPGAPPGTPPGTPPGAGGKNDDDNVVDAEFKDV